MLMVVVIVLFITLFFQLCIDMKIEANILALPCCLWDATMPHKLIIVYFFLQKNVDACCSFFIH